MDTLFSADNIKEGQVVIAGNAFPDNMKNWFLRAKS